MNNKEGWHYIKYSMQNVDYIFSNVGCLFNKFLNKIIVVDKLQFVLFITWLWVYAGLLMTKFLEYILKVLLKLPDTLLKLPITSVESTNGKNINIISAANEQGEITNKLKMLMRIYWQKGGDDQVSDENGIDCKKIFDLLKCSVVYICYLLEEKNKMQTISTSLNTKKEPQKLFVFKKEDNYYKSSTNDNKSNLKKILMRHLVLDD
jgi:hypothetical protein